MNRMSKTSNPEFVIISALQYEHDAMLRELTVGSNKERFGGVEVRVPGPLNERVGIAVPIVEIGRLTAAVVATQVLMYWRPRLVLLVGGAGGFSAAGVRNGDVLVATMIADFELQKLTDAGPEVRWRTHAVSPLALQSAQRVAAGPWWPDERSLPEPLSDAPRVRFGPLLSGEKVIAGSGQIDRLLRWRRDALGVEMEGAGIATAAHHQACEFLMIRGVADLADENKSDSYLEAGCETAAVFAVEFLRDWLGSVC